MVKCKIDIDFKKKQNLNLEKLSNFCDTFSPLDLVQGHTCLTKTHKISIDLLLTNRKFSFQLTQGIETGINDVHFLILPL